MAQAPDPYGLKRPPSSVESGPTKRLKAENNPIPNNYSIQQPPQFQQFPPSTPPPPQFLYPQKPNNFPMYSPGYSLNGNMVSLGTFSPPSMTPISSPVASPLIHGPPFYGTYDSPGHQFNTPLKQPPYGGPTMNWTPPSNLQNFSASPVAQQTPKSAASKPLQRQPSLPQSPLTPSRPTERRITRSSSIPPISLDNFIKPITPLTLQDLPYLFEDQTFSLETKSDETLTEQKLFFIRESWKNYLLYFTSVLMKTELVSKITFLEILKELLKFTSPMKVINNPNIEVMLDSLVDAGKMVINKSTNSYQVSEYWKEWILKNQPLKIMPPFWDRVTPSYDSIQERLLRISAVHKSKASPLVQQNAFRELISCEFFGTNNGTTTELSFGLQAVLIQSLSKLFSYSALLEMLILPVTSEYHFFHSLIRNLEIFERTPIHLRHNGSSYIESIIEFLLAIFKNAPDSRGMSEYLGNFRNQLGPVLLSCFFRIAEIFDSKANSVTSSKDRESDDQTESFSLLSNLLLVLCLVFESKSLSHIFRGPTLPSLDRMKIPDAKLMGAQIHLLTKDIDHQVGPAIGSGMNIVYKIKWDTNRPNFEKVAIKEIKNRESAYNEARFTMLSQHPNVIRFLYFWDSHEAGNPQQPSRLYLEFYSNGSLFDYLNKTITRKRNSFVLPTLNTQKISLGIARGMKYLHSIGIVHFDLNSKNIMLDESMNPRIADFGLSERVGSLPHQFPHKVGFGSVHWMAPELFKRKPNVPQPTITEKVDVYPFGIILWEVTHVGEVLHAGLTPQEIKKNVMEGKRPPLANALKNTGWAYLIQACWNHVSSMRPSFPVIFHMIQKIAQKHKFGSDLLLATEALSYIKSESPQTNSISPLFVKQEIFD